MKDITGREAKIGDLVVYGLTKGAGVYLGRITKIHKTLVTITNTNTNSRMKQSFCIIPRDIAPEYYV